MAKVSVQVNFTATANFAPLRAEISSLNGVYKTIAKGNTSIQRTGAAGAKATGGIRDAAVKAQGPLGQMQQTIDRNNMSFTRMISTIKKSNAIVGEHVAMQNAKANAIKMSNGSYKVQISLVDTLTTRMKMLSGQIGVATAAFRAMGSWMIKTGKNIQWAGRQIMVGLGVPLILLATAANRAAESYIKEMTRVVKVTTLSAASGTAAFARQEESVRRQTRVLVELGATMGFVADETAGMVAEFAQMGFAGRSLDLVADASLRLSRVSGADLDTSLQLTRITAQAFGIELDKLTETFAKLNLIENNTSLSLADMAEALPVVAGVANAVGLSIEQTSGFMAMMKDAGISAKEGATALRTGLIRIVSDATEPARKAFSDIGLSIDDMKKRVADGGGDLMIFFEELGDKLNNIQGDQQKMNDFTNAIGKLTGVRQAARFVTFLKEIPNAQKAIAVGQKAMKDALDDGADFSTALQVAKNAQDELMAGLSDTSGARAFIGVWADSVVATRQFERELENVNNSLTGIAERLRAEINVELAKVGESTMKLSNRFREFILNVLKRFNDLTEGTKKAILGFGTFGIAFGALIMIAGVFLNAFGNIVRVIGSIFPVFKFSSAALKAEEAAYLKSTSAITANTTARNLNNTSVVAGTNAKKISAAAIGTESAAHLPVGRSTRRAQAAAAASTKQPIVRTRTKTRVPGPNTPPVLMSEKIVKSLTGLWTKFTGVISKLGVIAKAVFGPILKIIGSILASKAALVLAVIGLVAVVLDIKSAFKGFMDVAGPSIQQLKDIFSGLKTMIVDTFKSVRGEGSGISKLSEMIGKAFGRIVQFIIFIGKHVINILFPVFQRIVAIISDVANFLVALFTLDFKGMAASLWSAIKNIFGGLMDLIVNTLIRPFLEFLTNIPGLAELAKKALEALPPTASQLAEEQGKINILLKEMTKDMKESQQLQKEFNDDLEKAEEIYQQIIKDHPEMANFTNQQLRDSELITEEEAQQLIFRREALYIQAGMNEHLNTQKQLERDLTGLLREQAELARRLNEEFAMTQGLVQGFSIALEGDEAWGRMQARIRAVQAAIKLSVDSVNASMARARRTASGIADSVSGLPDDTDDWEDSTEKVNPALERALKLFEEMKKALGEISGFITSTLKNIIKNQSDAIKGFFDNVNDGTQKYFDNFNDQVKENFDKITKNIDTQFELDKERIEETERLELARLDAIEEEIEKQERLRERFFAAEKARIDFLSGKQISSLQIAESLARGDVTAATITRIQQEANERQFVLETIEREEEELKQLQKAQRDFLRESVNQEKEAALKNLETRRDAALESVKDAENAFDLQSEAARQAANEAIRVAVEAAETAQEEEEIRIQNYLREWERVIPATEEEYQKHLKRLQDFLDRSGSRLNSRISDINANLRAELGVISSNFQSENSGVIDSLLKSLDSSKLISENALRDLTSFANQSFISVMDSSKIFTNGFRDSLVSATNLSKDFLKNFETNITKGFEMARDAAIAALTESKKWEDAAKTISSFFTNNPIVSPSPQPQPTTPSPGSGSPVTTRPLLSRAAKSTGQQVRDLQAALNKAGAGLTVDGIFGPLTETAVKTFQGRNNIKVDGIVGPQTWGKLSNLGYLHKGGLVGKMMESMMGNKRMRSDDMFAVLQKGEYVVNKSAVKSVGTNLLDKINSANRAFSPVPSLRLGSMASGSGSVSSGTENKYYLSFTINGSNLDEGKLAERVMFEIDKSNRNRGEGRRMVTAI